MDGYPAHYVAHNLPFVILFGLGSTEPKPRDVIEAEYPLLQEKGIYISSDLPSVSGLAGQELLDCFHDFDAKDAAWNNRPGKGKMGAMGFTYRSVGRVSQSLITITFNYTPRAFTLILPQQTLIYISAQYFMLSSTPL